MEETVALLIADLSGYTALTETHGAETAANVVEEYIAIVEQSLVGRSRLHQRVGDEVIIVSQSPADLASTAILLMYNCYRNRFLQIHGGIHYGIILNRNGQYFGNTINVASRIASHAAAGTILCSAAFANALESNHTCVFESKGKYSFKNVSEDIEVLQLVGEQQPHFYVDPVCRMMINDKATAFFHPDHDGVYFCSPDCLNIYLKK